MLRSVCVTIVLIGAGPAFGQDADSPSTDAGLQFAFDPADAPDLQIYGEEGTRWWYVHGGWGTSVNTRQSGDDALWVGVGWSWFVMDAVSVDVQVNGMGFIQDGDDALGLNAALLFRWHMVLEDDWSFYVDGGAGLLGTTEDVPFDGTSFNFTPQAGIGATFALDDGKRLMVGARWLHVSNASTSENNPGRDHIVGYVGVAMGF